MEIKTALTYDDVLMVPQKSDIKSRKDVDISTRLTKNINLKMPLVSANMDTVTESRMSIAMAMAGGIGIIHRFCDIDTQAKKVAMVKRKQNIVIDKPFFVSPKNTLKEVKDKISEFNCKSFLVTNNDQELLGILTHRDISFVDDGHVTVDQLMTPKDRLITAHHGISIAEAKKIITENKIEKLPLVDAEFRVRGLITATDIAQSRNDANAAKDAKGRLIVGAAVGVRSDFMDRVDALVRAEVDVLVVDIAHGHSDNAIHAIKIIKEKYPDIDVIGGNIATGKAAKDLIKAGADAVKIGVGPGSSCTTRTTTGFGVPQLTAVMNVYRTAKRYKIPIIADGGIRRPGDIAKAIGAGADSVMMGRQFSGTSETPGPTITYQGRQYKMYRGMASLTAALSRPDAKENIKDITPEGIEARTPYRGPVENIIGRYIGGLRSGMSYANAHTIEELKKNAQFIRLTTGGVVESDSHDNELL